MALGHVSARTHPYNTCGCMPRPATIASVQVQRPADPQVGCPVSSEESLVVDVQNAWEHIKVLCFTWNMGDAKPSEEELKCWLPSGGGEFDLVVVGVQECSYDWVSEWVATPMRNPKRRKSLKGSGKTQLPMLSGAVEEALHAFGSSPRSERPERRKSRDVGEEKFSFHWDDILAERLGDGFARVQQVVLMNMRLLVFAKTQYCDGTIKWQDGPLIHSVQHTYSATGLLAGTVGNKGGLVATLQFGPVSLCFVSCHLAAHTSAAEKRNNDCREILQETWPVCHPDLDIVTQFDHCFWFGDLNYRLDLSVDEELPTLALGKQRGVSPPKDSLAPSAPSRPDDFSAVCEMIDKREFEELMKYDQLRRFRDAGKAFAGFNEGQADFAPTFKVERQPGVSHQSERTPSYCDRILWKSTEALEGNAVQRLLSSAEQVSSSDHKPVYAHFDVKTPAARGQLLQREASKEHFPVVRIKHLKAHSLPGSHTRLRVVTLVLPLQLESLQCEHEMKVTKQGNELIWPYDLPAIRPAANNQEELQCCTLVMVLYSKGTKLGSIGLRFPGWSPSHALDAERFQYRFEKPLVLKSSTFGTGALSGTLEVNWNELGIAAENQLAAAARPKPVRPDKCCVVQ